MRPEECRAANLLRELLGARTFEPRDVGAAQGTHDFDLVFADGRTFAVEVTSHVSSVDAAFAHQLDRLSPLEAPSLRYVWNVFVATPGMNADDRRAAGTRTNELRERMPAVSSQIEAEHMEDGCDRHPILHLRRVYRDPPEIVQTLNELGVKGSYPRPPEDREQPRIVFGPAPHDSSHGPNDLVVIANTHLPRNRDKLLKAKQDGADEAHLFIWLPVAQQHDSVAPSILWLKAYGSLEGIEKPDLLGMDAVWVALDAGPACAPDCRHAWPIACCDTGGWHDWRMRSSRDIGRR